MTAELPITPEQRSNLEKLATLLERVVPPPEFDMSNYAYLDSGLTTELASKYTEGFDLDEVDMTIIDAAYDFDALEPALVKAHFSGEIDRHPVFMTQDVYSHCGTVACAAGHGPMAGIEAKPHESWTAYTDRVFGTKINGHFSEKDMYSWHWMFGAVWTKIDNTPKGAAARIRRYLDRGVPVISELGSAEFIARYSLNFYTSVIDVIDYVYGIDAIDEVVRSTYSEYLVP